MKALEIRENMINSKDEYSEEEEYADNLQHINENIEEICNTCLMTVWLSKRH